MARIRSIHPGLFTDEAFASLSMGARVLLLGIWTEADDHGVFEWKPVTLKMRIMSADNVSIPELLSECEAVEVIKRFTSGKSYGLVRNFCRFQRPKKPKYVHPMPSELRTFAGLNEDGSLKVLHQSRTSGENHPQREEEGGKMEEESGIVNEERERVELPRSDLKLVEDEKRAIAIDERYRPSDAGIEYAFSLGMKKVELDHELSKFITKSISLRVVSFNPDMNFKLWCDRWLDFKRQKDPDWKPEPTPELKPSEPAFLVIHGTPEAVAWDHNQRSKELRPLFYSKHIVEGVEVVAAQCKTLWPPGYDEATGERIPPQQDEDAA